MQTKKILIGVLAVVLLAGGAFAYSSGDLLQGRTRSTSLRSTPSVTTTTRPDFYFSGAISYDSGQNAFSVSVCRTNVASANVKLTSVKFSVTGGQDDTVEFTPAVTTAASCQIVRSGDLLDALLISQSGSYDLTATLDTTSVQTEASESNNTLTSNDVATASGAYPYLYDAANLPDLTVDDMYFEIDPTTGEYSVIAIVCGVDDLLSWPSGGEITSMFSLYQNGVEIAIDTSSSTSYFMSDGNDCRQAGLTLISSEISLLQSGTVTMYTQLDMMDNVPESNEDNNGFGQTFTDEIVME